MGKGRKEKKAKLEARLTEAEASLRDLESTRSALSQELRSARERHAEETAALHRQHEQLVEEAQRSQEELTRVGEELAGARSALETVVEEKSRLEADLRNRDEHSSMLEAQLQDAKALGDVLEGRALQAETRASDLQSQLDESRRDVSKELNAAREGERLAGARLQSLQRQLTDALKRLRDTPPTNAIVTTPEEEGAREVDPTSTPQRSGNSTNSSSGTPSGLSRRGTSGV